MNDHHLGDWLNDVLRSLEARKDQLATAPLPKNQREVAWYIDAIRAAVTRIRELEGEAAETLQIRDTIALQMLPHLSGHDRIDLAIDEALSIADMYLEARKKPRSVTIPSVRP